MNAARRAHVHRRTRGATLSRTQRLLPVLGLVVVVVLLGACSGSSKKNTVTTTPKTTTSASGTTSEPATDGLSSGSGSSADTGKQFSGDSNSAFCTSYKNYDSKFSDDTGTDSSEKVIDALKDLRSKAPSELKDDLDAIIQFAQQTLSIGSDDTAAQDSLESSSLGQKAEAATEEVTRYLSQVCGINS